MFKLATFLIISLSLATGGFSQGNNLREECRLRVGGIQLQLRDTIEMSKRRQKALEQQNKKMEVKIKELEKDVAVFNKKLKKDKLNYELQEQKQYATNRIAQLEEYISRNLQKKDQINLSTAGSHERFKEWQKSISPAFRIKKYIGEESLGYPYEVVYMKDCPPYQTSCPLDSPSKEAVKRAFKGFPFPTECERYIMQN